MKLKIVWVFLTLVVMAAPHAGAQSDPVSVIFQRTNSARAANGLYAYEYSSILATAAQWQASYMAQSGSITHTGPDGSTPKDRATAAGYPSFSWGVMAGENMYMGTSATAESAFNWWMNSSIHRAQILSGRYTQVGIGWASGDYGSAFVMLFGQPGDGSAPPKAAPKPAQIGETGTGIVGEAPPQPAVYIPVVKASPDHYGSVLPEVQPGQTIIAIAIAYDVSPDDIWRLNDMPKDATLIRPGDRLVVQAPPTPTPTASDTPTISPTWQRAVTTTPSPPPGTELPPTRIAAAATPPPAPPDSDTLLSSPAPTRTLSQQVWPIVGALLALAAIGRGWLAHRRRQAQN